MKRNSLSCHQFHPNFQRLKYSFKFPRLSIMPNLESSNCLLEQALRCKKEREIAICLGIAERFDHLPYDSFYYRDTFHVESISKHGLATDYFEIDVYAPHRVIQSIRVEHVVESGEYTATAVSISRVCQNYEDNFNFEVKSGLTIIHPISNLDIQRRRFYSDNCSSSLQITTKILITISLELVDIDDTKIYGFKRASFGLFLPYFLSPQFSDIEIIIEETLFPAHRFVLTKSSPVFARMFVYDGSKVEVKGIRAPIMRQLLQFVYTNDSDYFGPGNTNNLIELFLAADQFLMDPLKSSCERALTSQITTDTALYLWDLGTYFGLEMLLNAIADFCWKNRGLYWELTNIKELSKLCFSYLLCSESEQCTVCYEC